MRCVRKLFHLNSDRISRFWEVLIQKFSRIWDYGPTLIEVIEFFPEITYTGAYSTRAYVNNRSSKNTTKNWTKFRRILKQQSSKLIPEARKFLLQKT